MCGGIREGERSLIPSLPVLGGFTGFPLGQTLLLCMWAVQSLRSLVEELGSRGWPPPRGCALTWAQEALELWPQQFQRLHPLHLACHSENGKVREQDRGREEEESTHRKGIFFGDS